MERLELERKKEPTKNGLAPNVWIQSSVGRALHWYRGGHRLESRLSTEFFQPSFPQFSKNTL